MIRTFPCACGGSVTAEQTDPLLGVRTHVLSEPHRSWSEHTRVPLPSLADPTADCLRVDRSAVVSVRPARQRHGWAKAAVR